MPTTTFANPILPGFHPDPSVCRVGEDYYLVTSTFEWFPGVPVYHSRDLVRWRLRGHCLTRPEQLPLRGARASGGIYAPTIRHHDGRFYMVTTNTSHGGNFYVWADDPAGPWSDPLRVDQGGIDPSLWFDDDGTVYFTSNGAGGIYQCEIDLATGARRTETRFLWAGTGGRYPEAPHLYRIGDRYYLLLAEGGTEYAHMVTLARAETPWGPWEPCPHNPILTHRDTQEDVPIQATGHADLFEAHDGTWWMVFLGIRPQNGRFHHLGRETFLAPVVWSDDGWPVVNEGRNITLEMPAAPALAPHPWPPEPVRDEFDVPVLAPAWNRLRNPDEADYSLAERPGWLRLHGSAESLDDPAASPTFVARRLQHLDARAAARLDFRPELAGEEAGLALFMNEAHHYEVAIRKAGDAGAREVLLRRRIGDLQAVVAAEPLLGDGPVTLHVRVTATTARFGYAPDGGPERTLGGDASLRYLSTEVAGGFTGTFVGVYATGRGARCSVPADIDWFEYAPAG